MKTMLAVVAAVGMLACAAALAPDGAWAGTPSAREWGMAGAYVAVAEGIEAAWTNPANLGLPGQGGFSLSLVSLNTELSNNSFSLDQWNNYTSIARLEQGDKDDILSSIPDDGFRVRASAGANALGISLGRIAIAVTPRASASLGIARDWFDLLLNGNEVGRSYNVAETHGEGFSAVEASVSYAQPLEMGWAEHASVGVGVKALVGVGYAEVVESSGAFTTDAAAARGSGRLVLRYAGETTGDGEDYSLATGRGFALDLGAAAKLNETWGVSAVLRDLSPGIVWPAGTERTFTFEADSLTGETIDDEDIVQTDETVASIGKFTSRVPPSLRLGIARQTRHLTLAADWEQGFSDFAGTSTTPRLAVGVELRPIGLLPLRGGMSVGGAWGTSVSGGLGLYLGPLHLDVAAHNRGVGGGSSRGGSFGFTSSLRF